jgi:YfiR/HmsC-like
MAFWRRANFGEIPTSGRLQHCLYRPAARLCGIYLLAGGFTLFPMRVSAQGYRSEEYELKAAILFNLLKFVEWPATAYSDAEAPIVLCTVGRDPFGPALDRFAGDTVNGRRLVIRRLQRDDDLHCCHLVFVSSLERKLLPGFLKNLQGGPVLTVGEMDQFATRGGMVQLSVEDKQVHFTINLTAASRQQLRIRSNLLALARIVESTADNAARSGLTP